MTDNKMKWIDFSSYGAQYCVLELKKGDTVSRHPAFKPLRKLSADEEKDLDQIAELLGMTKREVKGHTIYVDHKSKKVDLSSVAKSVVQAGFKKIKPVMLDRSSIIISPAGSPAPKEDAAPAAPAPAPKEVNAEVSEKQPTRSSTPKKSVEKEVAPSKKFNAEKFLQNTTSLIQKANGDEIRVFTSGKNEGKRILLLGGKATFETILVEGESDQGPGAFLRAVDQQSLYECAQVIADRLVDGDNIRFSDVEEFANLIFPEPADHGQIESLSAEVDNALAVWMRGIGDKTPRDLFYSSMKIAESSIYKRKVNSAPVNSEPADINLGVAAAILRLTATAPEDKKTVFVNPGKATIVSRWKRGRKGEVSVFDSRTEVLDRLNALGRKIGLRAEDNISSDTPTAAGRDIVVANLASSTAVDPLTRDNVTFTRQEYIDIIKLLDERVDEGIAMFTFPQQADENDAEFKAFMDFLGRHYAVEGSAEIGGALHAGVSDASNLVALSVGQKRPKALKKSPEAALRHRQVFDSNALYSWTSEVLKARAKISNYYAEAENAVEETAEELERNQYQAPYVPGSKVSDPEAMCPKHLEGPMRSAMNRLMKAVGDVDTYVANQMGMTYEELAKRFSAEQVDALALEAYSEQRGQRGFHIADQTGLGKGRETAGVGGRHVMLGRTVIMATAKAANIQDQLRDLGDTGQLDHITPLIFNSGTYHYTDPETGETKTYKGLDKDEAFDLLVEFEPALDDAGNPLVDENGKPLRDENGRPMGTFRSKPLDEHNMILTTYSQLSGDLEKLEEEDPMSMKAMKLRWFMEQVDNDTVLVLDEAQNATGKGNTGKNFRHAIENANRTVFSSATHAKNAATMELYSILFPEHLSPEELVEILRKGGDTALESATSALAANGMYIRREHDNSRMNIFLYSDEENQEYNRWVADAISPIWAEIAFLTGEVNTRLQTRVDRLLEAQNEASEQAIELRLEVQAENQNLTDEERAEREQQLNEVRAQQRNNRRTLKKLQTAKIGLGSPLFRVTKNLYAALKAETIADRAIEDLRAGKKPVIVADSVQGELFSDIQKRHAVERENGSETFTPPKLRDFIEREIRNIFAHVLENADEIGENDGEGEQLRQRVEGILELIKDLPDLDISMIDVIKDRVRAAGFNIGEITGRAFEVDSETGEVIRRKKPRPQDVVDEFNNGDLHAVLASQPGLVGLSYHAAKQFKNRNPRTMHLADAPLDIVIFMQALGRIFRKGSLSDPEFTIYDTGIPVEKRAMASLIAKLRKLNANTSANRDSALMQEGMLDLFNVVGDYVCNKYFEARPEYLTAMGLEDMINEDNDVMAGEEGEIAEMKRSANQIIARLGLLQTEIQERIMNDIVNEYDATVHELDARNENPNKPTRLPGSVKIQSRTLFQGATDGSAADAFDAPVYLVTGILEETEDPFTGEEIEDKAMKASEDENFRNQKVIADRISNRRRVDLENALNSPKSAGLESVEAALASEASNPVKERAKRSDFLATAVEKVVPGALIQIDLAGETFDAIVTQVKYPTSEQESMLMASYRFKFAIPGMAYEIPGNFATLSKDPAFNPDDNHEKLSVWPGLNDPRDEEVAAILNQFDNSKEIRRARRIQFLEGNDWAIQDILQNQKIEGKRIGDFVEYEDAETGAVNRAAYLKRNFFDANRMPVQLRSPEMAFDAVRENVGLKLRLDRALVKNHFSVQRGTNGYEVELPPISRRKTAHIYNNDYLRNVYRQASNGNDRRKVTMKFRLDQEDQVLRLIREVAASGDRYWTSPSLRPWTNEWLTRKNLPETELDNTEDMHPENDASPDNVAMAG
ncbi:strawberry notch C-terminal domain-containing protein [Sulfitobacter sp. R18_1]|uniref:strawberry notch C-terminal domain-containing protein n=1 Tax=Sulfitobacter sp. R18_1 TaxID=2821104 RepID=UPI001ADD2614|nr:strawberry notch C-terminal domain-containing protein [Sulfitobacter sp. R18_1]MBO9428445.1 strawberry notch C-terminal domain-containing protein [Sulfitobacter sp. R18_1]